MNRNHEPIRQDILMRLLRKAHFDPQSHNREGMTFAAPLIGQLIDKLEAGKRVDVLKTLESTSGMLADKFNELGYHRSVYKAEPINADQVEALLRERLVEHFPVPPKLKFI